MNKISIYEVMILQEYFAKKIKPTKEDKARAKRLDEHLAQAVDGLVFMKCQPTNL